MTKVVKLSIFILILLGNTYSIHCQKDIITTINSGDLAIEVDNHLKHQFQNLKNGSKELFNKSIASDYIQLENKLVDHFQIISNETKDIQDEIGKGNEIIIIGKNAATQISKQIKYTVYDDYPGLILTEVTFINNSSKDYILEKWATNKIELENTGDNPSFFAFQGSSTSARKDWIRPLDEFYYDKNFMGMNNSDYGGGVPVVDLWRKDVGLAIGHTELVPKEVYLPTQLRSKESNANAEICQFYDFPTWWNAGDTIYTLSSFYMIHNGDYYNALSHYSKFMQAKGIKMVPSEEAAYEPIWCAWGYERTFQKEEIYQTLDKVKELGIKWAVMDDGFQIAEGEWDADPTKFPKGNQEIKEIVDRIHQNGLKAKIWWTPLAADPWSKVMKETPEAMLYTYEWTPRIISWWNAYYLSPVNPIAIDHTKETLRLFLEEWGFDGLKMDGQHMNAVPGDHNPAAKLSSPDVAVEGLPAFFRMIYDEARKYKPNAVIENCPCGTCMSFYNMASMNQAVSSDPLTSYQIRHKGKTYKALVPHIAYYGDHVELSDQGEDFASSFGVGGVLGTKFTYPADNPNVTTSYLLTPEKEKKWKKWFSLYNDMMISKGKYLGHLYDIGYDIPEAHAIEKEGVMYYAFYADKYDGKVTFKGLEEGVTYLIYDYVNETELGKVTSNEPTLEVNFEKHLLVHAKKM